MSARYFCDLCENELVGKPGRLKRSIGRVLVEVMVRVDQVWNGGHVCDACVKRVVNEGEPDIGGYDVIHATRSEATP